MVSAWSIYIFVLAGVILSVSMVSTQADSPDLVDGEDDYDQGYGDDLVDREDDYGQGYGDEYGEGYGDEYGEGYDDDYGDEYRHNEITNLTSVSEMELFLESDDASLIAMFTPEDAVEGQTETPEGVLYVLIALLLT